MEGTQIPLNARIIAIADVYDAVTADRPYRRGMNKAEAWRFMKQHGGILFDPEIVPLFLSVITSPSTAHIPGHSIDAHRAEPAW